MERVILHVDANSFYASVECLYTPSIREKAVAVAGSIEERHGIILTKNQVAKKFGIRTGEAIWQARQKCPDLVCVPPDYPLYIRFSAKMHKLYEQYSNRVESFGLDEAWVDVSNPGVTIREGEQIAHEIRERVKNELGITVSVGVADNKIHAKLGSDMKKPDAVTVIHPAFFRDVTWPLPVGDLLYVGPATQRKLRLMNVTTIGDLAQMDPRLIARKLGKNGLLVQAYANGQDRSPVMPVDWRTAIKSVGNSTTPPHDLQTIDDVRCLCYLLAESVSARMREEGLRGKCVSISVRSTSLETFSRQKTLSRPTNLTGEIAGAALKLFSDHFPQGFPYRSMGLSCSALCPDDSPIQLDFTGDEDRRMKCEQMEQAIDSLRRRYGHQVLQRCVVMADRQFAVINPVDDHTVHPVPFFAG